MIQTRDATALVVTVSQQAVEVEKHESFGFSSLSFFPLALAPGGVVPSGKSISLSSRLRQSSSSLPASFVLVVGAMAPASIVLCWSVCS